MSSKIIMHALALTAAAALLAGLPRTALAGDDTLARPAGNTEATPVRDWVNEALLALKVRTKLLNEVKSAALPVHVTAEGTTITLTGEVKKKSSLELSEAVAKSVTGVHHVVNNMTVAPTEAETNGVKTAAIESGHEMKDALLEAKIKSKLIAKTGKSAFAIEVEATDGVVSLSGDSPDRAHRDRALLIARQTTGALEVHDLMKIKPADADVK
jgi:osmotically-inducible protein OsmY